MPKKIVITGATGLIGKYIAQVLSSRGDEVIVFTRSIKSAKNILTGAKRYVEWKAMSNAGRWEEYLDGLDGVIHLAGEPLLGALWSDEYKEKILKSRELGTRGLVEAIAKTNTKPECFISASAIGYYGSSEDNTTFTEDGPGGQGFLAEVCKSWEEEASKVEQYNVRRVSVRVGIVLDKDEGALEKVLLPFKYKLGATVGDGTQWVSWIHVADVARIFIHALDYQSINGVLNATAPNPVRLNDLTKMVGELMSSPAWLKIPEAPIKAVIGESSVPVTEGIRAVPERTLESGYKFEFPNLRAALKDLLG